MTYSKWLNKFNYPLCIVVCSIFWVIPFFIRDISHYDIIINIESYLVYFLYFTLVLLGAVYSFWVRNRLDMFTFGKRVACLVGIYSAIIILFLTIITVFDSAFSYFAFGPESSFSVLSFWTIILYAILAIVLILIKGLYHKYKTK